MSSGGYAVRRDRGVTGVSAHLRGQEYTKLHGNRAAVARFQGVEPSAWTLLRNVQEHVAPESAMHRTREWTLRHLRASDSQAALMGHIDAQSSLYNVQQVLQVVRPIVLDALTFALSRASSGNRLKEQLAMPVSTAALADCINRESTIMYDGQQMCLPFGPDHLIFKVGFDGAKELSDHELSALFNLGRDGGVGESKFHTAKAFLRTVQKVMFYTTMTYLPSIMAPQYRADWKSFVDSWFIQYEANSEIALGRRRLAGGRVDWRNLRPMAPLPKISEFIGWVMENRVNRGLALMALHDVSVAFRAEGSTLMEWNLFCLKLFRRVSKSGFNVPPAVRFDVWHRCFVANPQNAYYSDYNNMGTE